jgi:hypothetical protein
MVNFMGVLIILNANLQRIFNTGDSETSLKQIQRMAQYYRKKDYPWQKDSLFSVFP